MAGRRPGKPGISGMAGRRQIRTEDRAGSGPHIGGKIPHNHSMRRRRPVSWPRPQPPTRALPGGSSSPTTMATRSRSPPAHRPRPWHQHQDRHRDQDQDRDRDRHQDRDQCRDRGTRLGQLGHDHHPAVSGRPREQRGEVGCGRDRCGELRRGEPRRRRTCWSRWPDRLRGADELDRGGIRSPR